MEITIHEKKLLKIYAYCCNCQKAWLENHHPKVNNVHPKCNSQEAECFQDGQTKDDSNRNGCNKNGKNLESDSGSESQLKNETNLVPDIDTGVNSKTLLANHDNKHEDVDLDENKQTCKDHDQNGQDVEANSEKCHGHIKQSIDFPGIFVYCDFVNEAEEKDICDEIYRTPFVLSQSGRRKQDYGPKVNFKKQKLKTSEFTGLPCYSRALYERMNKMEILSDFVPVELCNLEYSSDRGSSIDPHFDDFWLWGERLVTLNLLSDSVLCFTNDVQPNIEIHVPMFQRSLLVVYGPARHVWKHSIHRKHIKDKRIATTFRELSEEFKMGGLHSAEGSQLIDIALTFNGRAIGTSVSITNSSEP